MNKYDWTKGTWSPMDVTGYSVVTKPVKREAAPQESKPAWTPGEKTNFPKYVPDTRRTVNDDPDRRAREAMWKRGSNLEFASETRFAQLPAECRQTGKVWVVVASFDGRILGEHAFKDEAEKQAGMEHSTCRIECYSAEYGLEWVDESYEVHEREHGNELPKRYQSNATDEQKSLIDWEDRVRALQAKKDRDLDALIEAQHRLFRLQGPDTTE